MNTYVKECYLQYKQNTVQEIAATIVKTQDTNAIPELANQAAEDIVHGKLNTIDNTLIAEVAERDSFVPRNWVSLDSDTASLMKQLTRSTVSHDLRKTVRNNNEILNRAIAVRTALDRVVTTEGHSEDATAAETPLTAATEFETFVHEQDDYTERLIDQFHVGHAAGEEGIRVFDIDEEADEYNASELLVALEDWLATNYESYCPKTLTETSTPA